MIPIIYDGPNNDGIDVVFDFENGMSLKIEMDDSTAQQMIDMIQNKLNGRY